jgi:hypothetical protein
VAFWLGKSIGKMACWRLRRWMTPNVCHLGYLGCKWRNCTHFWSVVR